MNKHNNKILLVIQQMLNKKNLILTLLLISIIVVSGCTQYPINSDSDDCNNDPECMRQTIDDPLVTNELSDNIMKFSSEEELKQFLLDNQIQSAQQYSNFGGMRSMALSDGMVMESMSNAPTGIKAGSSNEVSSDFSQTNIQVEGVDEPDFVKNDNKYIYMIQENVVYIVDAFPAEDAEVISETEIEGNVQNMFVNQDRLIIFSNNHGQVYHISQYDYMPRPTYLSQTHAYVYDISDKENPKLIENYNIDGNYYQARMIGDYVYFITQNYANSYDYIGMPTLRNAEKTLITSDVYYFPNPESNYVFNTVTSFNIFKEDEVESKSFMLGYSNTLYVSEDNIYITYQKNRAWRYYQQDNEKRFYDVVIPLLPSNIATKINNIKNDDDFTSEEKWNKISDILEDMYNNMDEDDKEDLIQEISEAIEEYQIKQEIERSKTIIHRIAIDDGNIEYKTKGEVKGQLLNQFSLDEYEGNLRTATTTRIWAGRETQMYNNVYILDEDLDLIGDIEDIAPDERIYSTRFIGDRLYMVTFKSIDPFFVIDLSNPKDPEILGELKIPGFSNYLHPYDENHIIGIGKETEGNQWGGISTAGVKIALFDVSDVENPVEVDTYEIGERGTDSEALRDHKAFLFSKDRNMLVLPIREVAERYYDSGRGYYRNRIWQGAYVLNIDESGISLDKKITHQEDADDDYYRSYQNAVRRSLYMDDILYTISNNFIKMNDISDDFDEINFIEIE